MARKNEGVHGRLGKCVYDQNWVGRDEEKENVWQESQWCPGGLTRSQKRRVWCLRNRELETQKHSRPQTWHVKQTADKGKPSADINMIFARSTKLKNPSGYEQKKRKRLYSKIVKEDIMKIDNECQLPIQAVGSKDVF